MKECSVKYKAAQSTGQADGISWNDFRKAQCGKPAQATATESDDATPADAEAIAEKPKKAASKTETGGQAVPGNLAFPSTIAAKFASEKPAKARMHTCLEQYHANKTAGTLDGLRWIQKGGGYYKLCNAKLKGEG
ncbi:MAG: hypothetical protein ACREIP_07035 [Alphaproteobacteria bacterium]